MNPNSEGISPIKIFNVLGDVINPATEETLQSIVVPTGTYAISDFDVVSDTTNYFGYLDADGNWFIKKLVDTSSIWAVTYVKGSSGYTTAWTNRATQTYAQFNSVF